MELETAIRNRMAIADETAEMFAQSEMFDSAEKWETVSAILWAILNEAGLSDS